MTTSQSTLEINLAAMARNWQTFDALGRQTTAAVVKANGYGLGAKHIVPTFVDLGCQDFFVAHFEEAMELRQYLPKSARVFILNGCYSDQIDAVVENNLTPVINSIEQFEFFGATNHEIALHIDTGMSRLGLRPDDFANFEKFSKDSRISLVMSHLACSSDTNCAKNHEQLALFNAASAYFPNAKKSIAASAGALLGEEFLKDLIRPGIGLYGGNPLDNCPNRFETVVTLKSPILQNRLVKSGETIGYGATFTASSDMQIAIVALGYADGFLRSTSNVGFATFEGKKLPILGRVSMDLLAVDISEIPNLPLLTPLEFLGSASDIDAQASYANTISYEFLTRLGNRFARKYVEK